jgi:hypothetical protein
MVVFVVSFFVMGLVAEDILPDRPVVGEKRPSELSPDTLAEVEFVRFFHNLTHLPEVCVSGGAINPQEEQMCDDFWEDFQNAGILAAIPFLGMGVFLFMSVETLATTYRRVRKRVEKGISGDLSGTVTDPPLVRGDFFSWVHGFQSIGVELANRKQMKVYLPLHAPKPAAGQTMILFQNKFMGKPVFLAILYAPHVAVVSGVRPGSRN